MFHAGRILTLLILMVALVSLPSEAQKEREGVRAGAFSIVEAGVSESGAALYHVESNGVEAAELLKALFRKIGADYSIDQDVVGPVDLVIREATIEEVFARIKELSRPPINIIRDKKGFYRVVRVIEKPPVTQQPNFPMFDQQTDYYKALLANRFVNLNVPESRPIPLTEAVRLMQEQTRVRIQVDRRIPRSVQFIGSFARTPLPFALDSIAQTAQFKVVYTPEGVLLAPTDNFRLLVNGIELGGFPGQAVTTCPRCRGPVGANWAYCAHCGQSLAGIVRERIPPVTQKNLRPQKTIQKIPRGSVP
ncbi:MAG TPA: zinc ribbon domain-containing protein [Chthonomonadales bacterium]|nr:zinc ribbon domain-containing protein [Chthonomonadales bacterium]